MKLHEATKHYEPKILNAADTTQSILVIFMRQMQTVRGGRHSDVERLERWDDVLEGVRHSPVVAHSASSARG